MWARPVPQMYIWKVIEDINASTFESHPSLNTAEIYPHKTTPVLTVLDSEVADAVL